MIREGFSGLQVLVAMVGGAAVGAAVAYLTAPRSGAEARARLRDAADSSRERVARVPQALREAGEAARTAFTQAIDADGRRS